MKRLIGITGAFLLIYVIAVSLASPAGEASAAGGTASVQSRNTPPYIARESEGRIVIESGGTPILRTDTQVAGLPKIDRLRLSEGIVLYSDKELKRFLEDYCS